MVNTTLKTRLHALEAEIAAGTPSGPYLLLLGSDIFKPSREDDGIWAVEINGAFVEPELGESIDQLCRRAVRLHAGDGAMPVLRVCPTDSLLTTGVGDAPGPLSAPYGRAQW